MLTLLVNGGMLIDCTITLGTISINRQETVGQAFLFG